MNPLNQMASLTVKRLIAHPPRALVAHTPIVARSSVLCRAFATAREALSVKQAITNVKQAAKAKFDETVELVVELGVDPRKPNQNIRSTTQLPNGTGKTVRVAVFASGDDADAARVAGADVVGFDDLIMDVQKGVIDFDRCVATPSVMPKLGRIARILGPRGLMPNPKLGTVTTDVAKAIKDLKGGQVTHNTPRSLNKISQMGAHALLTMKVARIIFIGSRLPSLRLRRMDIGFRRTFLLPCRCSL